MDYKLTKMFLLFLTFILLFSLCKQKKISVELFDLKWKKNQQNPVFTADKALFKNQQIFIGSILQESKNYMMWYYGTDNNDQSVIGLAKSSDGFKWELNVKNTVLSVGSSDSWDNILVSKPCVFRDESELKMYYIGATKINNILSSKIGLATSNDGISWNKLDNNPVFNLTDYDLNWAAFLRYFWIIKDESSYKMWFSAVGKEEKKNIESIGYAWSENGLNWQIHPQPVLNRDTTSLWEDFYVSNPTIVKNGPYYYMFYGGLGRHGYLFKESIGSARSLDGINWTKYPHNPILIPTNNPVAWDKGSISQPRLVLNDKNEFYLYYVGADKNLNSKDPRIQQIGVAIGVIEN